MGACCSDAVKKFCLNGEVPSKPEERQEPLVKEKDKAVRKTLNFSETLAVWNLVFPRGTCEGPCPICTSKVVLEDRSTWEVAHVKAFKDGGTEALTNLRPVCRKCNRSMGKTHMLDYCKKQVKPERLDATLRLLRLV